MHKFGVLSSSYFPIFKLNMQIYFVNLHIEFKFEKIRTRKKSKFEHFSSCIYLNDLFYLAEKTNACNFANDTITAQKMKFSITDFLMVASTSHHGWPVKKILGFRWSKKVEKTLETISFWQNISISIFKFSQFLSIFKIY